MYITLYQIDDTATSVSNLYLGISLKRFFVDICQV